MATRCLDLTAQEASGVTRHAARELQRLQGERGALAAARWFPRLVV